MDIGQMMAEGALNTMGRYGPRHDRLAPKGKGFMGPLARPDGGVSTEITVTGPLNGKDAEVPALVPTLSRDEVAHLLNDGEMTSEIFSKAMAHAQQRSMQGQSPFIGLGELRAPVGWGR